MVAQHNKDLEYQPETSSYSFKIPFLKTKQFFRSFILLFAEIFFLMLVFVVILFSLNYFNIVSLSNLYPDIFLDLPHKPFANQASINTNLLSKGFFSVETNTWTLEVKFIKIENDLLYVEDLENNILTLVNNPNLECSKVTENKNDVLKTTSQNCDDLLKIKNRGKIIFITYKSNRDGNFVLQEIQSE